MANRIKKDNGNFKGKSISIGIDVHKLSWRVTAVSDGEVIMAVTLSRPTYEGFKKLLAPFKDSTATAAPALASSQAALSARQRLNAALVEAGLAWHYKKYSSDQILSDLEIKARRNKIGFWSDPHRIAPWEHRRLKRQKRK